MNENLLESLIVLVGVCIPLVILSVFFIMLKIIDWFYNAKEYDDKKLINKVINEVNKNRKGKHDE